MILLKNIIDEFMLDISDKDNAAHGTSRTIVLKHAKRGFEDLGYGVVPMLRYVQEELPDHKTLSWPIDALDIIRMSIIGEDGRLTPIYLNYDNPIAYEYLRDQNNNIVYDPISGAPVKAVPEIKVPEAPDMAGIRNFTGWNYMYGRRYGFRGGESAGAGQYRYNRESGKIHFFQLESSVKILFEYICSPFQYKTEAELEVHEYLRKPLSSWIYYAVIRNKITVPANEKKRARREYYHDLKQAKKRMLINPQEIYQAMKKQRAFLAW